MRGAARAIGWELFRRHRLGLFILAIYIVTFGVVRRWLFPDAALRFDPPNELAGFFMGPLSIAFFFFVAVFSYGLQGDLAARESAYPRRMFNLPVTTLELAGWPMFYGTVASVGLWIVALLLAAASGGTKGAQLPTVWPAFWIASFLVWMQALTWLAYPLRGLRTAAAILVIVATDVTVVLALEFHASEATMIAILAPQIVAAYVVGYFAVKWARCGQVPDWSGLLGNANRSAAVSALFASPARAQLWLEWRQHGRTLPSLVAWVVPAELALLFLPGNDRAGMVFFMIFVVLITPPAMAMLAAPALSTFSTHVATRPMTSAQLVAAKLEMTLLSTAAAWVLAGVLTVGALVWCGAMPLVVEYLRDFASFSGTARATLVVMLVLAWLVAATWKNLVQSLCVGLTGRLWAIRASVIGGLTVVVMAFPMLWLFLSNDKVQSFVWDYLPWMLVALVWLKVSAAAWIAIKLHDGGVLDDRALVAGALSWLAAVAVVYGALAWLAATPTAPIYFLGAIAILLVPLTRLSAAPLALAMSRHR